MTEMRAHRLIEKNTIFFYDYPVLLELKDSTKNAQNSNVMDRLKRNVLITKILDEPIMYWPNGQKYYNMKTNYKKMDAFEITVSNKHASASRISPFATFAKGATKFYLNNAEKNPMALVPNLFSSIDKSGGSKRLDPNIAGMFAQTSHNPDDCNAKAVLNTNNISSRGILLDFQATKHIQDGEKIVVYAVVDLSPDIVMDDELRKKLIFATLGYRNNDKDKYTEDYSTSRYSINHFRGENEGQIALVEKAIIEEFNSLEPQNQFVTLGGTNATLSTLPVNESNALAVTQNGYGLSRPSSPVLFDDIDSDNDIFYNIDELLGEPSQKKLKVNKGLSLDDVEELILGSDSENEIKMLITAMGYLII